MKKILNSKLSKLTTYIIILTSIVSLIGCGIIENKEQAKKMFEKLNFDVNVRGEKLKIQDFERICDWVIMNKDL